ALAQRLRRGRADAVGIVLPVPPEQFGRPFLLDLVAGLGEALSADGLDLHVAACPPGPEELGHYRRLVDGRRVDALVVPRTRRHDERIEYLLDRGLPFVTHGRSQSARQHAYLDVDGERGFAEAAAHLIALGHERIALINGPREMNFSLHREAGYRSALGRAGLPLHDDLVLVGDLDEAGGARAIRHLLSLPEPPTAVMCANDMTALGVMHGLREAGLRPGRDVSVTGYDDVPLARYSDPPLTTLRQPTRAAGRRLAEMLTALLGGTAPDHLQEVWPAELVVRATTGPARKEVRA
ncbi:MAG TPA: substrate-binding domain-containing protein, partial [Deinococcales bacterium]|nr:substrate-binding domain-containing protein [Deinococcales bacterium]